MEIRQERPEDIEVIRQITKAAFEPMAHSSPHRPAGDHRDRKVGYLRTSQTEAAIVDALRSAGALTLSLVAVSAGDIVGHVAFSPVTIDGADKGWYGLGPVSVRPDRQKEGIGGALIREGLARLAQSGAKGCVVLGDPAYYRRFRFENDPNLHFASAPAEYFMRLTLEGTAPSGSVTYHVGFDATGT